MGEVYRATDTNLGRHVAIKVLLEGVAGDPERLARFEREAKVLAALNHPNIAAIYGLEGQVRQDGQGGPLALVMELVEGPTLDERLQRGALPVEEALRVAQQMADALEAAHDKGIVHRDLKPANVKVTPDGTVKVLDFGLAKAMDRSPAAANLTQSPTLSVMATQAGGTWNRDGTILLGSATAGGGLYQVSASGGTPSMLTRPAGANGDTSHRFPSFLPDGRRFLYWRQPSNEIWLGSLDSAQPKRILTADSQAVFVESGTLLFARQCTLVAQSFDLERGTTLGEPAPIAEQILADATGAFAFSASLTRAVLAYRSGLLNAVTALTLVDRVGRVQGTVGPPGRYRNPELSPNGQQLALERVDPQAKTWDVWRVDLARGGQMSRITTDGHDDIFPLWSPDGSYLVFGSDRDGLLALFRRRADGAGNDERLLQSGIDMAPTSWDPQGRFIVYRSLANGIINLGLLSLMGERTPRAYEPSSFAQAQGQVSPNGRWIAYQSAESGRNEVYVQSFPTPGGAKVVVSTDGGITPRWSRDGRELFYVTPSGRLMSAAVSEDTAIRIAAPVALFDASRMLLAGIAATGFRAQYDGTRDGQRLLLNMTKEETAPPSITVVLNGTASLRSQP